MSLYIIFSFFFLCALGMKQLWPQRQASSKDEQRTPSALSLADIRQHHHQGVSLSIARDSSFSFEIVSPRAQSDFEPLCGQGSFWTLDPTASTSQVLGLLCTSLCLTDKFLAQTSLKFALQPRMTLNLWSSDLYRHPSFMQYWGLNLHACKTSILPTELHPQPSDILIFKR